jgi:hypothetical protein
VLVVSVQFFANDAIFIKAALGAQAMGKFHGAAMRAGGLRFQGRLPVGTAGHLTRMALTLLGNWHGKIPLI